MTYHPYKPTPHAEERRLEMGLGTKEIKKAINDPEVIYPGSGPGKPPGRVIHVRGRIAVVLSEATYEVVTILWHSKESRDDIPPTQFLTLLEVAG